VLDASRWFDRMFSPRFGKDGFAAKGQGRPLTGEDKSLVEVQ